MLYRVGSLGLGGGESNVVAYTWREQTKRTLYKSHCASLHSAPKLLHTRKICQSVVYEKRRTSSLVMHSTRTSSLEDSLSKGATVCSRPTVQVCGVNQEPTDRESHRNLTHFPMSARRAIATRCLTHMWIKQRTAAELATWHAITDYTHSHTSRSSEKAALYHVLCAVPLNPAQPFFCATPAFQISTQRAGSFAAKHSPAPPRTA